MGVLIDNQQSKCSLELKKLKKISLALLNALDCPDGELSILIVDDEHIARLNHQYFNKTGPTNVISFSMREGDFANINPNLLGDVIISIDTAQKEAMSADMPLEVRFYELLIHGILHIFGFDHEHDEAEAQIMQAKTEELLNLINPDL